MLDFSYLAFFYDTLGIDVSLCKSSIPLQTLILFSFFLFLSDPTICLPSCIVWIHMAVIAAGNDNPSQVLLWLYATVFLEENHMFYNHLNLLLLFYLEVLGAHKLEHWLLFLVYVTLYSYICRVISILPNKMIGVIGEHADFPIERMGIIFFLTLFLEWQPIWR